MRFLYDNNDNFIVERDIRCSFVFDALFLYVEIKIDLFYFL